MRYLFLLCALALVGCGEPFEVPLTAQKTELVADSDDCNSCHATQLQLEDILTIVENPRASTHMMHRGKIVERREGGYQPAMNPETMGDFTNMTFDTRALIGIDEDVSFRVPNAWSKIKWEILVSNEPLTQAEAVSLLNPTPAHRAVHYEYKKAIDIPPEVEATWDDFWVGYHAYLDEHHPLVRWGGWVFLDQITPPDPTVDNPYYKPFNPATQAEFKDKIVVFDNRAIDDPLDDLTVTMRWGNSYRGIADRWEYLYIALVITPPENMRQIISASASGGSRCLRFTLTGTVEREFLYDVGLHEMTLYYEIQK